jgi:hypothetical protein
MNQVEARDLVRAYLTQFGVSTGDRIPGAIIDNMMSVVCQQHFEKTKSLRSFWHTLVNKNLEEYARPDGLLSEYMVKVSGERYYKASYPYISDARRVSDGSTRVLSNGQEVDYIRDRWYWIEGDRIFIYPAPAEDTQTETSGSCTISGSTITISSGSLGDDNSLKDYLIAIAGSYYVIQSHDDTDISVDGSPDDTATTYTIYKEGLQIWGVRRPTELTINGSASIPGTDVDVLAIVLRVAYNVSVMLGRNAKVDVNGLLALANDYQKQAQQSELNKTHAPITIVPIPFRRDHAGYV